MRTTFITVAAGLALAGLSYALPTEDTGLYNFLSKRIVSPDNTCGNVHSGANKGYSCNATANVGGCCSQYGYCGKSTDHCSDGCQATFGICTAPSTQPSGGDLTCGPKNGDKICASGLCCSHAGYCGNTTDYCDTGCLPKFGICTASSTQPSSNDFKCGPDNGGKTCASGLCCSPAGYCGNTIDYCGSGCRSAFGICTVSPTQPSGGDFTCGPNNGGKNCTSGLCCSKSGYCGNTTDYCADPGKCLHGYGRCDSDTTPAGKSTANVPRPLKGPVTYKNDIYDCVKTNVVALTYDDGPYEYTSQLLDILKTYGFTATFFMTGNNNGKGAIDTTAPYPDLIKRMIRDGHQVASHTWSHYSLSKISQELRISQMVKNEMAINNIIGKWPTYMRPPYSDCTEASGCWADMLALGYHRVSFDLDTQDYLNPLPSQAQIPKDIVKAKLALPGATDYLSIQHDIVQQSVANLSSYYFDLIKNKGWKGVTAGECLGDAEENWYRSFT